MEMQPVNSSNINAIGYDQSNMMLHVEFSNGNTYRYFNVPPDAHKALMAAESVGKHFGAHIRNNFSFEKV